MSVVKKIERTNLESSLYDLPQLPALIIARILNLEISTLGCNLLSRERPLGVPPSRIRPPFLYRSDIGVVKSILVVEVRHWDGVNKGSLVSQDCGVVSGVDRL